MPKRTEQVILSIPFADYQQLVLVSIFLETFCESTRKLFNVLVIELIRSDSSTLENLLQRSVITIISVWWLVRTVRNVLRACANPRSVPDKLTKMVARSSKFRCCNMILS